MNGVDQTNYTPPGMTVTFMSLTEGYIQPAYTETYTFYVTCDDNAQLYVDGNDILGAATSWQGSGLRTFSGTYPMAASKWTELHLLYKNISGSQRLLLEWQSASRSRQTIPGSLMKWDEFAIDNMPYIAKMHATFFQLNGYNVWAGSGSANMLVTVASSAPGSPGTGDVWIDTSISL
jgi:hypothetical protein